LDLAALFPSILQDYMLAVLRRFLGHHPLYHMIATMYQENYCQLVVRGSVYKGFKIFCGVRQGCPLPGSLFALAFHPVIISISNAMYKHSMIIGFDIFAYADDLALVLYDFWSQLNALAVALQLIASATGLVISWKKVQLVPLHRDPDLEDFRRRLSAIRPSWSVAKIQLFAKYLGILVGPGVTNKSNMEAPLSKYLDRCRFISRLGLGWVRAASLHNIFALPVLSYVAQVQGDEGIDEADLDRAAAILFKNPMYRPPFTFYVNLPTLGVMIGLKDVRLECRAAAARCSLSLAHLGQARRQMQVGSNDEHLCLHPLRPWQDRSATVQLGKLHDQLRRECRDGLRPPLLQRQCRAHRLAQQPLFAYFPLIKARISTVLRRLQVEDDSLHSMMATSILDTILLASNILNCTGLQAFLRVAQNAFMLGAVGDTDSPCPLCGASNAARLSHLVRCGAVWVYLAEECPGLQWDYSHPDRWQFLLGSLVQDSSQAARLCIAWDSIYAGANAGRFGRDGYDGCKARLQALCCRAGFWLACTCTVRPSPA
jgi:hypothetical protein